MDGTFDQPPWPAIIQIIDFADRTWHSSTYLLGLFTAISLYYIYVGTWLDLLLTGVFIGLSDRSTLLLVFRHFGLALDKVLIPTLGAIGAGYLATTLVCARKVIDWSGPGRPYLVPCRTTHTRFFPKKHSFDYSYLVVGVPVGGRGNENGMISIDHPSIRGPNFLSSLFRAGWYEVSSSDYLQRGQDHLGLRGKLDNYLISEGVDPCEFPYAYLITAPRFLGYHFNPVSFWYLYSSDKILSAIVLEVNNTFDERRPYLVFRDFSESTNHAPLSVSDTAPPPRIKRSWNKDFHVSPFNSRKGTYHLLANDPLGHNMEGFRGLDITILLKSSKNHAKLTAKLVSHGPAFDPATMGYVPKVKFLARWFWVGYVTYPRIVLQAALLFFKKNLHVWYRPEPLKKSIGRHATSAERDIEAIFRSYLKYLVENSPRSLLVRYFPSGILSTVEHKFLSPSWDPQSADGKIIDFRVLTPIFYSRFVHYECSSVAVVAELTESMTIWVNDPDALPHIFPKTRRPTQQFYSIVDYVCFGTLRILRRPPAEIPRVSVLADLPEGFPGMIDIGVNNRSLMDIYVLEHASQRLKTMYRSALLRLFLADYVLFGNIALLDSVLIGFRVAIAWLLATALRQIARHS